MEVERRSGRSISRAMASDPAESDGPYETWSQKDSGEEAELVMCNREMKIHPQGEGKEEIGAQCILKRPPAAYKPIAAYTVTNQRATDSVV